MKQEDKDLLLKDLCSRLLYGVKILHQGWNYEWDQELSTLERITGIDERFIYTKVINDNGEEYTSDKHNISLYDDKPYLFPLSSMTEEQIYEFNQILGKDCDVSDGYINIIDSCRRTFSYQELDALLQFLNKNHFDYRGLIEKGLAIDATNLKIY